MEKNNNKKIEKAIRVNLNEELTEDFLYIKKHHGIVSDSDMIRFLIREKRMRIDKES